MGQNRWLPVTGESGTVNSLIVNSALQRRSGVIHSRDRPEAVIQCSEMLMAKRPFIRETSQAPCS